MLVLSQFLLRLSFGLALAMGITSPRRVTSGFYRVHLLVVMGLCTLATLVAVAQPTLVAWPPLAAAILSYIGSVIWLYEGKRLGMSVLWTTSVLALIGVLQAIWQHEPSTAASPVAAALLWSAPVSSGLALGATVAAMFLGHWYLNTPTMDLAPLRRLLVLMAIALALRIVISGVSLAMLLAADRDLAAGTLMLLVLRWLAGLVGVLWLTWMSWQTLKIPNTQSATGILYVAVIGVFAGELISLLLSEQSPLPL